MRCIDLLARGFFPREVPPPFNSRSFAQTHKKWWPTLPIESDPTSKRWKQGGRTELLRHNLARQGALRRILSVPNPIWFSRLAQCIEANWLAIDAHLTTSPYSKSTPVVGGAKSRAVVPRLSYVDLPAIKAKLRTTAKYTLKADISQFYQSIYTHSIPWALHGKNKAKANNKSSLFGNILDTCVQYAQSGQTVGIPIGPDSSLILAEIILASIGSELQANNKIAGFHHIDDFEFAFDSFGAAEEGLSSLQGILSRYELSLNPRKTLIRESPTPIEQEWHADLAHPEAPIDPKAQRGDLIRRFDAAFRWVKIYPDANILNFLLGLIENTTIEKANWKLLQSLLLQTAVSEAGCIRRVFGILLDCHRKGWPVDYEALDRLITLTITKHAILGHGTEVSWSVWGAIVFVRKLDSQAVIEAAKMSDNFVALLCLDARARGLISSNVSFNHWNGLMNAKSLYGDSWLLAYEANVKNWGHSGVDYVKNDPYFSALKSQKVEFYKIILPPEAGMKLDPIRSKGKHSRSEWYS